jgi:putative transposase
MQRINELHLESGSRLLRDLLAAEGSKIGRRHVTTLMKRMIGSVFTRAHRTYGKSACPFSKPHPPEDAW